MKSRNWLWSRASLLCGTFVASAIYGPVAAAQAPPEDTVQGINEIVVTAQKREQSANDVPMSINAFSGGQLEEQGIATVEELTKLVPGFNFTRTKFDNPVYRIRGIGYLETSVGAPPAVALYTDETPLPYPVMGKGAMLDVERVEVLKGPQGTLYGQNSTGGLVNFIAAKPSDSFEGGLRVGYARFGELTLDGFASAPLSDDLGVRVALKTVRGGAWQRSITRDDELGDRDLTVGRILLNFEPTDRLRVLINVNGWVDRSDTQAAQLVSIAIATPSAPLAVRNRILAQPIVTDDPRAADWDPAVSFQSNQRFGQIAGRVEFDISDDVTLTSITSYSHFKQRDNRDLDGTAGQNLLLVQRTSIRSFYQELRIAGEMGDRFNWIVGANYAKDRPFEDATIRFLDASVAYTFAAFAPGAPPFSGALSRGNQRVRTAAGFVGAEYAVTDTLSLQASARYTSSRNHFDGCTRDLDGSGVPGFDGLVRRIKGDGNFIPSTPGGCLTRGLDLNPAQESADLDEDNVSWRAGVTWQPTKDVLVYINGSRGYKAGSFSNLTASTITQYLPARQESVLAYEVGTKLTFLDGRFQANAAAFYYDYSNKQTLAGLADPLGVFPPLPTLINVPKSRVAGVELDLNWNPTPGLRLHAGGSYLDSKILQDFTIFNGRTTVFDWKGSEFSDTPKWYLDLGADYEWSIGDGLKANVGADYGFKSSSASVFNATLTSTRNPRFSQAGARIGLGREDGRWNMSAGVRNLFDTRYWTSSFTQGDTTTRYMERPRTYGLTLSLGF